MILERILDLYRSDATLTRRRAPGRGWPTGSQAGTCAAQLQMLRFPGLTKPEPRSIRAAWVLADGDMHAADLRADVRRAFPGLSGLEEELFYFPVPLGDDEEVYHLVRQIDAGLLWGTVAPGFLPPRVVRGDDAEEVKDRLRLTPRDDLDRPRAMGFVVDPQQPGCLWVPLYIDHLARLPDQRGFTVIEYKSMSRFAFRRALLGVMGYRERAQLAVTAAALGDVDSLWLLKCKDTAHRLEIAFSSATTETRVTVTRTNGRQQTFRVPAPDAGPYALDEAGQAVELREDDTWDVAHVWTPYDTSLLDEVRERVRRVLLYEPPADPTARLLSWHREYGPDFACPACDSTGTQRRRKNSRIALKEPKPCEDCQRSGHLDEVMLPAFPCGYCPVVATCFPMARLEVTDKPRYYVRRRDFDAAGLAPVPQKEARTSDA